MESSGLEVFRGLPLSQPKAGPEVKHMEKRISFSCPICGRRKDYCPEALFEGVMLKCGFCGLELSLQGCMWEEIKKEKERLGKPPGSAPSSLG